MLFALMLAGLILASAIPKAFHERGLWFALAYVAIQVGRSLFIVWALSDGHNPGNYRNFQRITVWMAVSGVLWIAGGLAGEHARPWLWAGAMLIELVGPSLGFWTPHLGRSASEEWE